MPTFEELRRNKYGDSTPQVKEEEVDESTVPLEERLPAPYEDADDIMVSELLNPNTQLSTEQQEQSTSEEFTSEQWFGLALGTSFELTAPIASNIAYLKWLNRAKAASKAAKPLKGTPLGLLGFGAAEVTIGALSNVANQKIQQHYKSQKAFKISEVFAAGVFNASPVVKVIDGLPVFKFLQPKTGSKFSYRNIVTKGGEKLVSGAAIGLLESAFRQSVSGLLQEEDLFDEAGNVKEGVYRDLLVSAGVGATLNTALHGSVGLFSYWRTKGKAGRAEAVKLTDLMDGELVKQVDDINKEIQKEAADVGIFTNFAKKKAKIVKLKKQRKQVEEAQELNQQLKEEIQEENARVDEAEANPKPIEEEQTLTEEELDAPDEKLREEEPAVVAEPAPPTAKEPETVVKQEPIEEPETPKPETEPTTKVLKRDNALQSLIDRTKAAFSSGDVPTIEGANIIREGKKLYDNSISIFTKAIHTFREGGNKDVRALQIALDEVVFLRKLNQKVSDPLATLVGRGTQSHRQDAAKYNYQTVLSERAGAESDAWSDVEKSLRQTIENEADVTLFKNIQDALDVRPRFKRLGQELDRQATQDFKKKLREAAEKEPKEIPQEVIISRLQKKLREAQEEFAGLRPEQKAKKGKEKSQEEIDIQNRLDFYATGKREAKQIAQEETRLETYLELLEEGDLAKIRQEVGPAPDWANKKEVGSYLAKIRQVNNRTKKLLQKQVVESDISLQDPNKVAKAQAKQKAQLEKRLKELQKRFGDINKIRPKDKPKKTEADAEIEDLKNRIKFHEANEADALKLEAALTERARLLKVETGPLGQQRAEITKPKGPTKVPGELEKVNKDIAFLRSNMRKRVDEIDRARVEMDEKFQEAKMLESIRKRRAIAQKRLDERRERFADDTDLDRRAAERAGRKIEETDPVLLETQEKIKFYDELEAEALKKKQLKEELARRAETEGRAIVSEMRAHLAPKPTGPQKVRSTDKIRQEIRDSDKRMRDKLKDIDAAEDSFRVERIYETVRNQAVKAAERDVGTKVSRFMREWGNHRVYAMIWQTSSVLASALGGIASSFKQLVKLGAEPIADLMTTRNYRGTQIKALQVLKANAHGLAEGFRNWKGTGRAVTRTAKNLQGATGGEGLNRLTGDVSLGDPIRLLEIAEAQAKRKRLRGEDVQGVQHILARLPIHTIFSEILKLPLRGIMPIDELFRRQLLRAELMSEAWKDAFDAIPNDPTKASELAADLYKQKWTKDQGLEILSQEGVNATATDTINKELLFDSNVANLDPSEIARPISDKVLEFVKELKLLKDNPSVGALIHLLSPIMTVVARGAGRSIRVGVPLIPAAQAARNPYNRRIKKTEGEIRNKDNYIAHEETTPQRRQELQKEKEELEQRIKELKGRRIAYHRDAITDTLLGSGMMAAGYGMGAAGVAVGTLAWMTPEQRRKFEHKNPKAKANTIEGWGYRELFPLSIGFAIGADYAMYSEMKEFTDEEGKPILTKDQSAVGFILKSITELFKEVPIAGGMKSVEKIMSGESEQINSVLADWLGSFALMPSQINKIMKLYFEKGSVEELKGGDWQDRTAYKIVGHNPTGNKKTDHFGHDLQSPKTWLNTFIRWAPDRSQELNAFDEVYKKDIEGEGQLIKPPSQFPVISGIDMYKFVDNNGVSLHYRFNQEVKKLNIDKTIIEIVKNPKWRAAWQEGSKKRTGTIDIGSVSNPALQVLNTAFTKAYKAAAKNMMKNKALLNEFISEEENEVGTAEYNKYGKNKTLKQLIDEARGQSVLTGKPISVEEVLGRNDLDELLEANPQMQIRN
jgi:hypothetical protein